MLYRGIAQSLLSLSFSKITLRVNYYTLEIQGKNPNLFVCIDLRELYCTVTGLPTIESHICYLGFYLHK